MALVCPACGTENRSVAKFCIECIAPLATDFVQTQVIPRPQPADEAPESMPAALAAFVASLPPVPPSSRPGLMAAAAPPPAAEPRKGLWVSMAALAVALLVGAGGWLIAGAGGWYIYSTADAPSAAPQASGTVQGPVHAQAEAVVDAATDAVAKAVTAPMSSAAASEAPAAAAPVAVAPVVETPPAPAPPATLHASVAPPPKPSAADSAKRAKPAERTFASCEGLGFIAASRCKVDACSRPPSRDRAECREVLSQQRLMDEKRNPTMAN